MPKYGMMFVQGKDRPGIIQAITKILYQAGANLEDISMTLLEGQFAMMLSFKIESILWDKIYKETLVVRKAPWNLNVDLISISKKEKQKKFSLQSIRVTAIGKDRTGIVHQLSSGMSKIHANITSLDCRLLHRSQGKNLYSLSLEVDLPKAKDIFKVKRLIKIWQSKLGVEIKLHLSESAIF